MTWEWLNNNRIHISQWNIPLKIIINMLWPSFPSPVQFLLSYQCSSALLSSNTQRSLEDHTIITPTSVWQLTPSASVQSVQTDFISMLNRSSRSSTCSGASLVFRTQNVFISRIFWKLWDHFPALTWSEGGRSSRFTESRAISQTAADLSRWRKGDKERFNLHRTNVLISP